MVVSCDGRSAPLGVTRDLTLDGVFIATAAPLPLGSVLPIGLQLPDEEAELRVHAEVVHRADDGMGLRFLELDGAARRRLRRFVAELTSVLGSRETAERLHDHEARTTAPLRDRIRIAALLERTRSERLPVMLIPGARLLRETALLERQEEDSLLLTLRAESQLQPDEEVFALVTVDFVSYSFEANVVSIGPGVLRISKPDMVVYSERRSRAREPATPTTRLKVPVAWAPGGWHEWTVCEVGSGGLSFRAPVGAITLAPGMPLEGAVLVCGTEETLLESAEVRHITLFEPRGEAPWLRIGVATGPRRSVPTTEVVRVGDRGGFADRLSRMWRRFAAAIGVVWHTRARPASRAAPLREVRIHREGHELVGLLNVASPDSTRVSCPLVIVVPGFGGRKEQMSSLAMTLVDTFRRNQRDLAVLRVDGTNNLGQSTKDTGCAPDGRHTLRYTLSGVVDDLRACLQWARSNPHVDVTQIVVVSVSFASVAVRHALTLPEAADVGLWVSYMGAADARDAVHHVHGHLDLYENAALGKRNGTVNLFGCMVDCDNLREDMSSKGLGDLDDARREMAEVKADVVWIAGRHDAFMDLRRVRDVMGVVAPGARQLVEVDAGHVPRTGDEALRQFALITRKVWGHIHHGEIEVQPPPLGFLAAVAAAEWARVRRNRPDDPRAYWKSYLLGIEGPGFDVLTLSPAYQDLVDSQLAALAPAGLAILDLGAGTGNLSRAVLAAGAIRCTAVDLVPEALAVLRENVDPSHAGLTCVIADLDGGPRTAMRRWITGDLGGPLELSRRIPGVHRALMERVVRADDPRLYDVLRGRRLDVAAVVEAAGLPAADTGTLVDLNALARLADGRATVEEIRLETLGLAVLAGPTGLPFPDAHFDGVVSSLVLSHLLHPLDLLSEVRRVLAPGGRLVVSSMRRDADAGGIFQGLRRRLLEMDDSELPARWSRESLLSAAATLKDRAADLFRLEEEGVYTFFSGAELSELVCRAGFEDPVVVETFGVPPQAVVVACRRPSST